MFFIISVRDSQKFRADLQVKAAPLQVSLLQLKHMLQQLPKMLPKRKAKAKEWSC